MNSPLREGVGGRNFEGGYKRKTNQKVLQQNIKFDLFGFPAKLSSFSFAHKKRIYKLLGQTEP